MTVRALLAALALFLPLGDLLCRLALPRGLRQLHPLLVLPVGAAGSSLALTILGYARIPLPVSLTVVVAGALAADGVVRMRRGPAGPFGRDVAPWLVVAALATSIALLPLLHFGVATVPGFNPDAHLVTGTAVLLQDAPPGALRPDLPVDELPAVWRSKVPILYALAGTSELADVDPIEAFAPLVALLAGAVALGLGLLAHVVLGTSSRGGMAISALSGLSVVACQLAWHPYFNQLWGAFALPYALVLGWVALRDRDRGAIALTALVCLLAALAYPLILPYLVVLLVAFAAGLGARPVLPWSLRTRALVGGAFILALAVPLYGMLEKGLSAGRILVDPSRPLWAGDITEFVDAGLFVGLPGGSIAFGVVVLAALAALMWSIDRVQAVSFAVLFGLSVLVAFRLRLSDSGPYFDFKHGSFVGMLVLVVAAAGLVRTFEETRRTWLRVVAAALAVTWAALAVGELRTGIRDTPPQVTAAMLDLRGWTARLPATASVRLDVPASGTQLWAAYMLSPRRLTALDPVSGTTYPHVPWGVRATYSLTWRRPGTLSPPVPQDARGDVVRHNRDFSLWRIAPAPAPYPVTASARSQFP